VTARIALPEAGADGDVRIGPIERLHVVVPLSGHRVEVRMTRVQGVWLASASTVDGPTLGRNQSPYLALSQALEPLGGGLVDALQALALTR
jgi:hypothetical protein